MIGKIGPMLGLKLSAGLNLLLIAALVLSMISHRGEIKKLNNDIAVVRTERDTALETLGRCRANSAALRAGIESQNRSVEAMATQAEELARRGSAALSDVRISHKPLDIKISEVQRSTPTNDNCASADALILRSVK
jgi:predicted  nucleic acid-binding Zn-ribbon protein